jgi:ankyrin repeat protein
MSGRLQWSRRRLVHGLAAAGLSPAVAGLLAVSWVTTHAASAEGTEEFFRAVEMDRDNVLRSLLKGGQDPNQRDAKGQVALVLALREESSHAVDLLLNAPGLDVNAANQVGETPLMMAALKGQLPVMARLLALGAAVRREGWTPLHYAASGGNLQAIELLLSRDALLDARAPNGNTALMMAAAYGTIDGADLLLRRGADPRPVNLAGRSASELALAAGRDDLAKLLAAAARPRSR